MTDEARGDTFHALPLEEAFRRTASGERGLERDEIPHRLERYGPNAMTAEAGTSPLRVLLHHLHHPLIYLLLGAALISLVTGHWIDAVVIALVVIFNTLIGATQEWKADKALDALRDMAAPHAHVLREGRIVEVNAADVVPGDILVLETGDRVAADARVIEGTELHTDESALTGESDPVGKTAEVLEESTQLADRRNMVWMSTAVTAGRGRALVVSTGMKTVLGQIAGTVRETEREQTPLQRRLARLGTILGVTGIGLAGLVFVLGMLRGHPVVDMVLFAVAVAVSAIPEGMPAVISVTLALGVQRMARRSAIIRRLPAVETLGSTTVICSDKTGTITRNEMTATRLWTLNDAYTISGAGFSPEGAISRGTGAAASGSGSVDLCPEAKTLLTLGTLNNNARVTHEDGTWQLQGSPTDGAILIASRKAGMTREDLEGKQPRLHELPFSSEKKYAATLHPDTGNGACVLYVKGGSDRVLSFCTHAMVDGLPVPLTDDLRAKIEAANATLAGDALRVLTGAVRTVPATTTEVTPEMAERDLVFIGLWGLVDPPRPEAIEAIRDAHGAGIRVVMITGDHAATAKAIAQEVGICGEDGRAVTGAELDTMDDTALDAAAAEVNVYARVSPNHKLRILQALKARGQVVAMTGDGVNDAPALKGADIGIAMGKAGTEVAKEASDMILTDDNFATIVHAVEEGRAIFANLRRVVFFLMTTNLAEILTLVFGLLLGLPLPLTAVMILWINLVTDGACTIPLGIEPMHNDVLKHPPRAPGGGVLNLVILRRMMILAPIMAAGTLGLFWWSYDGMEDNLPRAMTIAFTTLAVFQWFHALNARTSRRSVFSVGVFSNLWVWLGIGVAAFLQVLTVHTAFGRSIFNTVPLSLRDWGAILLVSAGVLVIDEILKAFGVHGRDTVPDPGKTSV